MERPAPILWFSRFYLTDLALRTAAAATMWSASRAGVVQVGLTVALLLWFGVVYRRSNVARWIAIAIYALGAALLAYGLALDPPPPLTIVLQVAALVFGTVAVAQLITTEANDWFAAKSKSSSPVG